MNDDILKSHLIGDVTVKSTIGLSKRELNIEHKYLIDLKTNLAEYIDQYRGKFGKFVSADKARSLFEEYVIDPVQNSTAVSAPAFALAENVFKRMLQEIDPEGSDLVTILTGGGGSGKTTAAEAMQVSKALMLIRK